MRLFLALVLMGALSASCNYGIADISGVPDNPTFNRDIYPLFRDHCQLCHGSPANRGAPNTFRLDVYDDSGDVAGAMTMAGMSLWQVQENLMPPSAKAGDGVGPNGQAMLQKWVDNGTPR